MRPAVTGRADPPALRVRRAPTRRVVVAWICIASCLAFARCLSAWGADHDGPLTLTGTTVYTIQDATFSIDGPVTVQDSASLVIRNSTILLLQDYHEEHSWMFSGSGQLLIENSTIVSAYTYMLAFGGSSCASIDRGQLADVFLVLGGNAAATIIGSTVRHVSIDLANFGTTPGAECELEIANSLVHEISFGLTGDASGTVSDIAPGVLADWSMAGISDSQMSVHLANTEVEYVNWLLGGSASVTFEDCVAWQLGVKDSGQAIVRNSHVGQAVIVFDVGQHAVLRRLTAGALVSFWGLHDADPSTNVPFNFTVTNSTVDGWYLRNRGADLVLEDCNLHGSRLRPEFDSDLSLTRVVRTYVEELMLWWSHGTLQFEDSTVHHIITPVSSSTTISGSLRVEQKELKTDWGPWNESSITREYPVHVTSEYGLPLARVPVSLRNPGGTLVLSGETDTNGLFTFSITFDDSGYSETWTLQVGSGSGRTPVSLLTDTPLNLEWTESAAFRVVGPQGHIVAASGFYGQTFVMGAADVAEWVLVSEPVGAGDVLELDGACPDSYRPSKASCSALVAGVVSSEPGMVLGATRPTEGEALLALSGIVPVKVTNEGGPIQPGDLLVSSSTPGYAMRWAGEGPCPCALVGKALEPMTDERGVISVLLTAQ